MTENTCPACQSSLALFYDELVNCECINHQCILYGKVRGRGENSIKAKANFMELAIKMDGNLAFRKK